MIRLPLVPKSTPESGLVRPTGEALPLFYMNDYSRIGLWVSDCASAARILQDRFTLERGPEVAELLVDGWPGIVDAMNLLSEAGIACGVSDIVDQVYQG